MDDSQDFASLQHQISSAVVKTTRTAGQLSAEDLSFQRALNPDVAKSLDKLSARLLRCGHTLLQKAIAGSAVGVPPLKKQDDLENNWRAVVDGVDLLLEKADTALDEYSGLIKKRVAGNGEEVSLPKMTKYRPANSFRHLDLTKPQLQFLNQPTNYDTAPFKPLLKYKPHAVQPFHESLVITKHRSGMSKYKHPYETEITNYSYPETVYARSDPIMFKPFNSTTATYVDTLEAVHAMLTELKAAKEIAVDLEHHDTRSYVGIVCLMQISTREKDWIVDTLKPWREELQVLNEVFADPQILKVFHGAYMDIVWLQRDLGLYVVGLFDTYHAARALGYPQASLAALLSRFVNLNADKKYQMADWRIRPLPVEMFDYARSDTHFLLYIYDNMRNALIDKANQSLPEDNPLDTVQQKSKETALQLYERFIYDESRGMGAGGWYNMLRKTPALFSKEQFSVFRAVHRWRDRVAREQDDSVNYVMPKHVLFSIARAMPVDMPSLIRVLHPISTPAQSRTGELLAVIQQARETGAEGPDMASLLRPLAADDQMTEPWTNSSTMPGVSIEDMALRLRINAEDGSQMQPVRSLLSSFWGSTFGSSLWEQRKVENAMHGGIRLALPLPPLTAQIFQDAPSSTHVAPSESVVDPGARAEHSFVRERVKPRNGDDGIFIIKQLGGSRKRKSTEMEEGLASASGLGQDSDDSGDGGVMIVEEDSKTQLPAPARAASKAEIKRAAPLEAGVASGPVSAPTHEFSGSDRAEETSVPPFDYANAASVLHAGTMERDRLRSRRGFDPYSKAGHAPSGARRVQGERPGKTMTFRR